MIKITSKEIATAINNIFFLRINKDISQDTQKMIKRDLDTFFKKIKKCELNCSDRMFINNEELIIYFENELPF